MCRTVLLAAISIFAVGCAGGEGSENSSSLVEYEILPCDTIGEESGDEHFVFGDICAVETDNRGNLLVLDCINCVISRYTPEGEYSGSFAGRGSGPGEILDPMDMAVLSDGRIAVADWEAWGIFYYSADLSYCGFTGPLPGGSPLSLAGGADGSVTGLGLLFWNEDGQPAGEYFLASWAGSPEESFRFMEGPAEVTPGENGELSIHFPTVVFDSNSEGDLLAAVSNDSSYAVYCYNAQGEEITVISEDWEKEPLNTVSADELEGEMPLGDSADGSLYADAIIGIYCDSEDRIWVRSGTAPFPLFKVYTPRGELICTASCRSIADPLFEMDFHISDGYIYGWNTDPSDYPKIIVMENPVDGAGTGVESRS